MMRRIWMCGLLLCAGALVAAPIPKDKEPEPATDKQRLEAQNNLKQMMLAFHNYESAYGVFPHDLFDKNEKPLLSWRVAILPFIEEGELYKEFALDEPWDSKTNKPLIAKMPKLFDPVRVKAEQGQTFYRGFTGNGAFFRPGTKVKITGITDGTSNSIGIIEAGDSVIWSKPGTDIPFDPKKELSKLGKDIDGVFHAAMLDGSVLQIKRDFDKDAMKGAITIDGGEIFESKSLSPEKK